MDYHAMSLILLEKRNQIKEGIESSSGPEIEIKQSPLDHNTVRKLPAWSSRNEMIRLVWWDLIISIIYDSVVRCPEGLA